MSSGLGHFGSVERLTDEAMRETFETTLFGPARVLKAVLPAMRAMRSGVIVNVSSTAGRVAGLQCVALPCTRRGGGLILEKSVDGDADPDTLAEAIVDTVAHDDGRVHFVVGEDANVFHAQYASSTDAEMAAFYKEVLRLGSPAPVSA